MGGLTLLFVCVCVCVCFQIKYAKSISSNDCGGELKLLCVCVCVFRPVCMGLGRLEGVCVLLSVARGCMVCVLCFVRQYVLI